MEPTDLTDRRAFAPLNQTDSEICLAEGIRIYKELIVKFGDKEIQNLDGIMNSLCCALVCLLKVNVKADERRGLIQVIHKIITKNTQDP